MTISVNTSGKDFDSIIDSLIDFATIQYGEQASANRVWSDFNLSSFSRNWAELVAYVGDQLMFYMDTQANQAYLRSATIPSFVIDIANQLGYEVPTQQASSGKVRFTFSGPAQVGQFYPVFANNTQFITTRAITASQSGTIEVDAIQGAIFNESFIADGIQNEQFTLLETDIIVDLTNPNPELRSPIVTVNGTTYNVVNSLVDSAPNSTDVVRKELPDGRTRLIFGDGIFGRRLVENESVRVIYRTQGGTVGNVEAGEINTLGTVITGLDSVTNTTPFSGGVDRLTLQQIKDRVPLSLKTVAGAVSLPDFADILIANFPQVLTAKAALNTTQSGIDIDIFVLPNSDSVTNITDNPVLFNTLTDFIERRKVVGTQFLIKNANPVDMSISIEVHLNSDASRSSVEADIREQVKALFDLQTGGSEGRGVGFQELVKIGDLFDVLKGISGISRFEIKKHTINPRVDAQVSSRNQNFYISKVDVYGDVGEHEWMVATSEIANPEPSNGQVSFKVFKRTLGNVTSLQQDSITDSNLDLTEVSGEGIVIGGTTIKDQVNVFTPGQYNDYLLVDINKNIWRITDTSASSITVASPALNDAAVVAVPSGDYRVVQSYSGEIIGIGGASFSILYNNHNTFFSPGASFDLIATLKSPFILSKEQGNTGTYGVPVSIASVTAQGTDPGDLVDVTFNGNPNLIQVDKSFNLIDSVGEVFEIESITDNDSPVASYNNPALIDSAITLVDAGPDQAVSIEFIPSREVESAFLNVSVSLEKISTPQGSVFIEIRSDDGSGNPGAVISTSNAVSAVSIAAGMATIDFNFPYETSLTKGSKYHLVIQTDSAYKTSYAGSNGEIRVGIDTTTLDYSPAKTAEGSILLKSNALTVKSTATGSIEITNNFIRSSKQASMLVKLLNNDKFLIGDNSIIIHGQPFQASNSAGTGKFLVGADISATRDNLVSAINTQLTGVVSAAAVSSDMLEITADSTAFKGESGNSISVEVIDQGDQNFDTGGLNHLVGGLDGDKIEITSPQFVNSTLAKYTYNSPTGVITYIDPVSLPTLNIGDKFRDGAGNEFDIIGSNIVLGTVLLDTGLAVNTEVTDRLSGSIYRVFNYTFGDNVSVGATATDSATNLATVINPQPYVNATSTGSVVNLESVMSGKDGNTIRLAKDDAGQDNFVLSGEALTGGVDGDVIAIQSVNFTPVSGTPSMAGEFKVDSVNLNNTLANLSLAINTHPSLTAVVTSSVLASAKSVQVSAVTAGSAGNLITLAVVENASGQVEVSGETLSGGEDNLSVGTFDGSTWTTRVPDSDMIFYIGVSSDSLTVVSKIDSQGNQVVPQISVGGIFNAGLGKRYYSDQSEVSFIIATRSPNSFILGGENIDIFGKGINAGSSIKVDQFVFRTSKIEDDVTNLRASEIPVLKDENLKTNLLGGVS